MIFRLFFLRVVGGSGHLAGSLMMSPRASFSCHPERSEGVSSLATKMSGGVYTEHSECVTHDIIWTGFTR
jgi:hypothetical protein